jgi:site-specific recombinase XerC
MAQSRKDNKGRVLRKGETQRSCDGKYVYTYTDSEGKRRSIYSKDIMELREREAKLIKDQLDGLDVYVAGNSTVNFVFDRYISTKSELRKTTLRNYTYMYDHFIRGGFGKKKIATVKYSDVLQFYQLLLKEKEMQINTLETIHTVLHPTFQLAVRDNIIRTNPSDGVMAQIKKQPGINHGVRHALTVEQQRAFVNYIEENPTYYHWTPFFKFLLGTGCRIGDAYGKIRLKLEQIQ